jgi:predicted ferric reductase
LKDKVITTIKRTPTKRDPTEEIIFEYAEIESEEEFEERLDAIADAFKLVAMEIIKMKERGDLDEQDTSKGSENLINKTAG